MELDYGLETLEVKDPELEPLLEFLASMEFRTLSRRMAETMGVEAPVIAEAPKEDAPAPSRATDPEKYEIVRDAAASRHGSPRPMAGARGR